MKTDSTNRLFAEKTDKGLRVYGDTEKSFVLLEQRTDPRPHLHPLRPMDGVGVLTENSPGHHPWQHGLYCALHGVGESDFWFDPGQNPAAGTIETEFFALEQCGGTAVKWRLETVWRANDGGRPLLRGTQRWALVPDGRSWRLSLEWSLRACEGIIIKKHQYGGLFLRMPNREGCEPSAFNSGRLKNLECEQQNAEWICLTMKIDGRDKAAGFVVSQHPENAAPHRWRLDGQYGLGPVVVADALELKAGESRTWRYGIACISEPCSLEEAQAHHETYLQEAVS